MSLRSANSQIWLLIVIGVLILLVAALGSRLAVRSTSSPTLLLDDFHTGGGAALARWANQLGYKTVSLQSPVWEAARELPGSGHCLITVGDGSWTPLGNEVNSDQWRAIENWVVAGNAFIVATSETHDLPEGLQGLFSSAVPSQPAGKAPRFIETPQKHIPFESEATETVPTFWGGEFEVDARGPRLAKSPQESILAGSTEQAVLVQRRLGRGRIYLLLDDQAWTNDRLDAADNAAVLARILKQDLSAGGLVAVDGYRHGRGRPESFATFLLSLPGARAFCGLMLGTAVFWVWARNRRFGAADPYDPEERRTAREYILATASMNERAHAASLALGSVVVRLRSLLRRRGSISSETERLLTRAQAVCTLENRSALPEAEIRLVRELNQVRRQLHGTR